MDKVLVVRDYDFDGLNLSFQVHACGCDHFDGAEHVGYLHNGDSPHAVRVAAVQMGFAKPQVEDIAYMDCSMFGVHA